MSLHTLANHVQSAGRGDDKLLVHMTPGEVNGLQSLAMAHGGSLTTNPETGLPEAGILSSLLPTLIGFGLAPFTGGMSAALITGAGYTAATGSLKKGIMAGLGAYGGAGLAGGLSSLGTTAAAPATAGLSPTVAANTSALAGTSPLANVGTQGLSTVDDIFAGVAKAPVAGTGAVTTPGVTSAALNQTPLYPQVNFATGMPQPPTISAGQGVFPGQSAANYMNPVRPGPTASPNMREVMEITGPTPIKQIYGSGTIPAPKFPPGATGYGLDAATGKYTYYGPGATPLQATAGAPQYVPSAATTSQPFAGGMQGQYAGPSNAVNTTGQVGPYQEYMSRVGEGAKTAFKSTDGLKALYSATEAATPYATMAGLGSTALTYADEKRQEAEDEMRRAAGKSPGLIRPYDFEYNPTNVASEPYSGSGERTYFNPIFTARKPYEAPGPEYRKAGGGLTSLAAGGAVENPRALLAQAQEALVSKDPVQQMSQMNAVGGSTGYPMANIKTPSYNVSRATPIPTNVIDPMGDTNVDPYTGAERFARGGATKEPQNSGYSYDYNPQTQQFTQTGSPTKPTFTGGSFNLVGRALAAGLNNPTPTTPNGQVSGGVAQPIMQPTNPTQPLIPNINIPAYQTPEQQLGLGGFYDYMNQQLSGYGGYAAGGGVSSLGDYSDGGRLLKGPGDGVSDSIPASIGNRQPARLADGEFVVPARIVSEIGNGSTEAGARKLYAMMDRVQKARRKTVGKGQVARNTKAEKLLPV